MGGEIINHFMRIYDFEVSQRPDILVANSKNVQARISKFYRRDSVVIYPPVDLEEFKVKSKKLASRSEEKVKKEYFLTLTRLARSKGVDVIIEVCNKLSLPLKVAGIGPEMENLKRMAGKNVEFLGWVSDEDRVKFLIGAKALIVAAEDEDFGITPVEAQAAGTPVIAPASGGFLETVIPGKTGLLYGGPGMVTVDELIKVLEKFDETEFRVEDCKKQAEKFSQERFKKEILDLIRKHLG